MNIEKLNEVMGLYLVKRRNGAGLSQRDVAARSDIYGLQKVLDQKTVSRIEQQPLTIDFVKVFGYLSATGVSIHEFCDEINKYVDRNDLNVNALKVRVNKHSVVMLEKIAELKTLLATLPIPDYNSFRLVDLEKSKPIIGFFGHFDAGKSTLINTLIAQNVLPSRYQPLTSILNLLVHVDDRPSYINNTVAIFKAGFNPSMLFNKSLANNYLIEVGSEELLHTLGTHHYDDDKIQLNDKPYMAVVFIEADILRHVWLLDTAGDLSNDKNDTEIAFSGVEISDGAVLLSSYVGFLKSSDLGLVTDIFRLKLPLNVQHPIEHLLVIASHCHSEITTEESRQMVSTAIKRVKKQFDTFAFQSWKEDGYEGEFPTSEELLKQVQPFWKENLTLKAETILKIQQMAKALVFYKEQKLTYFCQQFIHQLRFDLVQLSETTRNQTIKSKSGNQFDMVMDKFDRLMNKCHIRRKEDISWMRRFFDDKTAFDAIKSIISDNYDNQKEAQNEIGNYIGQLLSIELKSLFRKRSKHFISEVEELLEELQDVTNLQLAHFFEGLKDLPSIGAFAVLPVTVGYGEVEETRTLQKPNKLNLNDILAATGLVGAATGAALGAATIAGVSIASAIGLLAHRITYTNDDWETYTTKKVMQVIRTNEEAWDQIEKAINDFWISTELALTKSIDSLVEHQKSNQEVDLTVINQAIELIDSI
jgi:transcriptional regulator with XRE-family HTH domain